MIFFCIQHLKHKQQQQQKVGPHQTKNLLHNIKKREQLKRQHREWKKLLTNHTSGKGLTIKIHVYLSYNSIGKNIFKKLKWTKNLNKHFSQEYIQTATTYLKAFSISLMITPVLFSQSAMLAKPRDLKMQSFYNIGVCFTLIYWLEVTGFILVYLLHSEKRKQEGPIPLRRHPFFSARFWPESSH